MPKLYAEACTVAEENSFRWPHTDGMIWYTFDNILCKTNLPKPISHKVIGSEIDESKRNEQY